VTAKAKLVCEVCGTALSGGSEACPVCALRGALGPETTSLLDFSSELRFEHYQVLKNKDGTPVELGRGAMGITYKADDINLRRVVALKIISTRLVGDELAHRRFVREARAAASVRHPNVASVFHLGKSDDSYFYAMEFVEGETLQSLIKRSGRLDVKLVLEIAAQVAGGLVAIHEQDLIHRDIKPSNVMVGLKDGRCSAAKIIDLGLAKAANESTSNAGISTRGAFAGTPEFASPEQFAGIGVDIRSDIYSLGIVLWEMLTGRVPFNGSVAEVMYQHLHTPAPVELLKDIPQPVIVLLEVLLDKDPTQRCQTPKGLLNAILIVTRAIERKRAITHQEVRTTRVDRPISRQEKSSGIRAPKRSIAVLPFDTLGHGKRDTYFADGVQDEILSNLAKVSQLNVISRTSVMTFRPGDNRNLRSIAESLGVANVVEGTVRRDGKRVRITIRLVDARIDKALWSERYDRDLTDIFAIQSEIAQAVASKLSARLSPEEKKRIEAKPTENLEAYDLYLRAKELLVRIGVSSLIGSVEKALGDVIGFLEQAVQLDPKFTLAYCASAQAHDFRYPSYDSTVEQRALGDAAMNNALRLQPNLPEVRLTYARHLYSAHRDYDRARLQLAIARQGLTNSEEAIVLGANMDCRQGKFEKAIRDINEAITRDPGNINSVLALANELYYTRQFRAAEQAFDRLIDLRPDLPIVKVRKPLYITFYETGDDTAVRSAIVALPKSMADDRGILSLRLMFALNNRDWPEARELIEKMKGGEDEGWFAYGDYAVPVGCYSILLARLQDEQLAKSNFAETRKQLNQRCRGHL
jgi:serine/threonine protein kinase